MAAIMSRSIALAFFMALCLLQLTQAFFVSPLVDNAAGVARRAKVSCPVRVSLCLPWL